ncbi:AI-2E family transporter [Nocardioides sp. JQ2195]|uniref:AI-2E family transporter n=1 Tax=Nocardioides sp. JQ2195 TaxID=2592334 RepID=UPI00143E7151|nr:AI-2E family transporter [Nocardioides sp. JQ2195]QIX27409.1 AI-2E family transporter [Nocardioides sp. JQ2195]
MSERGGQSPEPSVAPSADGALDEAADDAERSAGGAGDGTEHPEEGVDSAPDHHDDGLGQPGPPINHSPYYIGFFGGLGALTAFWLGQQVLSISGVLVLIVVSMFLAAGLNPLVEWLIRRGLPRSVSVIAVIVLVLGALALFLSAIVPVITEQVAALTKNAPGWLDMLLENKRVQEWNADYDLIGKAKEYIEDGDLAQKAFGGVLGFGVAVLSALANTFIVVVLTLYFLASLPATKKAIYQLAPASRRPRVTALGDEVLRGIGGYVSGAFVVAVCAGLTSLVFLFVVGLGEYAVALAFVVALLDVIPMIGATIGAVIVTLIGFATDPKIGVACLIFYVVYQQVENYAIYPKVMSRSVDIPGAVIVIAALVGGGLMGVLGALMAVPTAAAILLLTREVFIRRQDHR